LDAASAAQSSREDDYGPGLHADVIVDHGRAFIIYFTQPQARTSTAGLYPARRSSVLVAELDVIEGQLVCDRGRDVSLELSDEAN
jgi:hypothetical protein